MATLDPALPAVAPAPADAELDDLYTGGISLGESLRIALDTLTANVLRTVLTALGVIIGVAAVVALLAIGRGTQDQIAERITANGANLLTVRAQGAAGGGNATLTLDDATALADPANVPDAAQVSPEMNTIASVVEGYVAQDVMRDQRIMEAALSSGPSPDPQALKGLAQQLAQASGDHIVVADGEGLVVADSADQLVGQPLPWPIPAKPMTQPVGATGDIFFTQSLAGTATGAGTAGYVSASTGVPMFIQLDAAPDFARPPGAANLTIVRLPHVPAGATGFLQTVSQSLLLAALAAGLVALLLTLLLSRRILGPVEALTAAARRMEKGDLTRRVVVQSQDEIGELAHAFNAMAEGLTQLEQGRRRLITDVAHELRTPLSNLRGYLEAVQDGVAQPTPDLIASLHEEAVLLGRLVDDLQELALAEAGQLRLVRRPVAVSAIVQQAVSALQPTAGEKGVTLTATVDPALPRIWADPARLGQVLRNLLHNALTHTGAGGQITVSAQAADHLITVQVRDTGSGITPDDLPHIFERFYRADRSRARATGGAGLGLAIVKQLVELHGGQITVASTPGAGATFTFTLPIIRRATRPATAAARLPPPGAPVAVDARHEVHSR